MIIVVVLANSVECTFLLLRLKMANIILSALGLGDNKIFMSRCIMRVIIITIPYERLFGWGKLW